MDWLNRLKEFNEAVAKFEAASRNLASVWSASDHCDVGSSGYPDGWDSFDEEVSKISAWLHALQVERAIAAERWIARIATTRRPTDEENAVALSAYADAARATK